MTVSVRRVTDPADPALVAFGHLQEAVYYQPEMLIPASYFGQMIAGQAGRRNVILVAEQGGEVVGGTLFHLLVAAAFSSFMGVSRSARGSGAARVLHQARLDIVRGAGGAGVFADAVHVSALNVEELAAEEKVGSDPTQRRLKLGGLGFFTVDAPYWQPVGGPDGGPLTDLDLLYCPLEPGKTVALSLVTRTLETYWQGWLGPERAALEAQALAERTGHDPVDLLSADQRPRAFAV
ncbi:GNAT family N-acetyltransferase [Deinococcus sp.]|uniref:GNAT family N-acetyltransferase n=1 Tax=Deinococcus sp. TaxID=47478 RepID=UPI0025E46EDD|nr:GNAT family N-acetyltransferase [Deinococcus sp.]